MSFEWNKTIQQLYLNEPKQILDDAAIIKYKMLNLSEDEYETLEKEVKWDNHDNYYSYDEEGISCWEFSGTSGMGGFISRNFPDLKIDEELEFTVKLTFKYYQDHEGEWDVNWVEEIIDE